MFRSATFKLTVYYLALTMTISFMFSIVVYRLASNDISHGIHMQTQRIYNQFPIFKDNPILSPKHDIDDGIHTLLVRLLLFNLVVLILAGLVSYLLAKITLQPIEEAHEQQKRFTADVSHELRTPLTALRMESEVALLSDDAPKEDLRQTIKSNLEEVTKLENLINNLLRLTRLEYSELRQNFTSIGSEQVSFDALNTVNKLAASRNIKIQSEIKNVEFIGDQSSVSQLLIILLDNAIKYSPSNTTILFKAKPSKQNIIFTIEDQGIGIEKEALDHIFDRFYRANSARNKTSENDGHGLGLSIAKTIADVHNASITVSSQINKGTTVKIIFPLNQEEFKKI